MALDVPFELNPDMMASQCTQTLHEIIQHSGPFSGLKPSTRSHDIRKCFFLMTMEHFDEAKEWIDTELQNIHSFMPSEHISPEFPFPRRSDNPSQASSIASLEKV